ncbi:hypothetical protein BT63DRAFT_422977 [Microthyrium microscopicum]|uniref:CENP-V/GFA domain-containing protein n=1 Tax=Microthyrium microscopicum TaxID=703497 RepID=A0A6A6UJS6_9PEZI|nr:hypothetical protein BT63DRAFT_422977 [Microthyrium microscopicum]
MSSDQEKITITAECLCKTHTFNAEIPTSELPLKAVICHCNSCRHVTGALYSMGATWPVAAKDVDTSTLITYQFSDDITILFCGTCSSGCFFEWTKRPGELGVITGVLKNHDVDLVKIMYHMHVEDTIDGGATMWLRKPNVNGDEIPRFKSRSQGEEYPHDWPPSSSLSGYHAKLECGELSIQCHCKGVDLILKPGNYQGKTDEELPWFIDPRNHKPKATFDVCDSCRLQSGVDIFHWTFSELTNIFYSSSSEGAGKAFPVSTAELKAAVDADDPQMGTLAYYKSSPDVQRYFCKNCSAMVFYAVDDRPDIVDVAIGLLNAPDGARAESFLSWTFGDSPSWADDTKGGWREGLWQRVQAEAEQWRNERGYPKSWKSIQQEEKESKE